MKKTKATEAAPITRCKYTQNSIIWRVRILFLTGGVFTAKGLNQITSRNDSRKVISDLRKQGMNIVSEFGEDKCKHYWLQRDNSPKRQLDLFNNDIKNEKE